MSAYMAKMFLTRTFAILGALVLILQSLDLLTESGNILAYAGNGDAEIWRYVGLRVPQIASTFLPYSVLLGSILTLTFLPSLSNNIYAQIGLITLIGLAAKNAILIVEFAKERVDRGIDIIHATLQAVRLRLRPIVMTSLAFILGVVPLMIASGAAAESRKTIGWTVFGGMLAATTLAIFVVPVLFALITKLAYGKKLKQLQEEQRKQAEVDRKIAGEL